MEANGTGEGAPGAGFLLDRNPVFFFLFVKFSALGRAGSLSPDGGQYLAGRPEFSRPFGEK